MTTMVLPHRDGARVVTVGPAFAQATRSLYESNVAMARAVFRARTAARR